VARFRSLQVATENATYEATRMNLKIHGDPTKLEMSGKVECLLRKVTVSEQSQPN
jgi:hypothetical protein